MYNSRCCDGNERLIKDMTGDQGPIQWPKQGATPTGDIFSIHIQTPNSILNQCND